MNNLIRVEDAKLYLAKNYIDGNKSLGQCLDEVPTVNAIVIPDNATNGDVIKALFPNFTFRNANEGLTRLFDLYSEEHLEIAGMASAFWWNAPYKKGEASE